MGRNPKPWWWQKRGAYFATVNGKRVKLGTNLKVAGEKLKRLRQEPVPAAAMPTDSVAAILDRFLVWVQKNREHDTYVWYHKFIEPFSRYCGDLEVGYVTACHVSDWIATHDKWGATTRRSAITAISRGFNFAVRNLGLAANPIRGMEKPAAVTRTDPITLGEFKAILRASHSKPFRHLLEFCWDCGCRPQEARQLEPRHVDLQRRRCVLPAKESKGKQRSRVIYLATERALRLATRGMDQERIFLNNRGRPWTALAIGCRFRRLKPILGTLYHQYSLRHTWITRKLIAGVDSHVVATLAGHTDTKMLDKVYSHVADNYEFLLEQARKEKKT